MACLRTGSLVAGLVAALTLLSSAVATGATSVAYAIAGIETGFTDTSSSFAGTALAQNDVALWQALVERTHFDPDRNAVITGGTWSFEKQHIDEIKERLSGEEVGADREASTTSVVDLSGQTDLLTLGALIAQARLLITVDSAAMHLAAAQGVPQVALFGPTNPFHWRPRHSPALILFGDASVPTGEFSPRQDRRPMRQISTEAVFNAMDSLLSAPAARLS